MQTRLENYVLGQLAANNALVLVIYVLAQTEQVLHLHELSLAPNLDHQLAHVLPDPPAYQEGHYGHNTEHDSELAVDSGTHSLDLTQHLAFVLEEAYRICHFQLFGLLVVEDFAKCDYELGELDSSLDFLVAYFEPLDFLAEAE
jgi:hypothetical protein